MVMVQMVATVHRLGAEHSSWVSERTHILIKDHQNPDLKYTEATDMNSGANEYQKASRKTTKQ